MVKVFWSPDCDVEILAYAYWDDAYTILRWCQDNEIEFKQFNILNLDLLVNDVKPNQSFRFTNRMDAELCFLRFTDGSRYVPS